MNKKFSDLLIGCLLISTLSLAIFIVSCSDDSPVTPINASRNTGYHTHVHTGVDLSTSVIGIVFGQIGVGAVEEVGQVGMGWVLGAMGLTSQSPNYTHQLEIINDDLDSIINLLNDADDLLTGIDSILNVINCTLQQTSLQAELSAIQTQYTQYNVFISTAAQGDTIPNTDMQNFANTVINGSGSQPSIEDALSSIQVNINTTDGVIVSCMETVPVVAAGTFGQDSIYYPKVQSILNYYYYYQTIGLGLLSEAYHYNAWVDAGSPGSSYTSADSVMLVCDDNSKSALECNEVVVQTNTVYNTLLTQFNFVGEQYTNSDLIYQLSSGGQSFVWIRSLEDFTEQSGAGCTYPLETGNYCGPAAGYPNQTLSYSIYYGTSGFELSGLTGFNALVDDATPIESYATIGDYLQTLGFENMSNKILISDSLVLLTDVSPNSYFDTMHVVPFINTSDGTYTNTGGTVRALYSEVNDFKHLMGGSPYSINYEGSCVGGSGGIYKVHWRNDNSSAGSWDYLDGYTELCEYEGNSGNQVIVPLYWLSGYAPGWSYYLVNSSPQKGFLLPVRSDFSGSTNCLPGYSNTNIQGVVTLCGEDYQDYLDVNLPEPATCDLPNITPPCN